jgi:DNA-binding XRE family transcriptional regulator
MITAAQLRAARGLLDWTRTDLAKAAGVSPETIKNIEHGTFRPQESTADAIIRAFATHDVKFTENEGVQKSRDVVTVLEGLEDFKSFMDELYRTAQLTSSLNGEKPIYVCNVDNQLFKKYLKDYATLHIERMMKIEDLEIKALSGHIDRTHVIGANYLKYRFVPESQALFAPFYVFGDKLSMINFNVENAPRIISINSEPVAKSYREQFEVIWGFASKEPIIAER